MRLLTDMDLIPMIELLYGIPALIVGIAFIIEEFVNGRNTE